MNCPDDRTLRAFLLGDLGGETFDAVARHVAGCPRCESSLDSHDEDSDDLVQQLRSISRSTRVAGPDVPHELMLGARSVFGESGHDGSGAPEREIVLDAGYRIARSLAGGPHRLGKFDLLEELGVGSFGYVFRARDTELDREVAVKLQRKSDLDRPDEHARFLREARSAAQLEHPGIVTLYETGQTDDGALYLVTELVEGRTLEQVIRDDRPGLRDAAELIARVADALAYAHGQGVIHRDIKPSNILVDTGGRPHLTDFGLAKREIGEATMTADGEVMGTPAYMSPEQACGESHHVDARSDIFSLGVILYELLAGDRPFRGNRRMLMLQLLEDEPRPPRRLNEKVPRDLETICLKAMAKEPPRRYATAAALADDLRRANRGEPIQARPASMLQRLRHWSRRNPIAASLFLAVTLGSTTGMLYLSHLSGTFVEQTARSGAEMEAEVLEVVNTFYSEIVQDNEGHDAHLPLPATFTKEAGRRISESKTGMQVRLYSDFPFRGREALAMDAFEQLALRKLRQRPAEPYYEFTEMDGGKTLRFATARVMQPSCITCHNTHEDSRKTDWQVGDVRGVLEIIRPLHKDVARVRDGLSGAFILVGVVSAALLGLGVLVLFASRRPRLLPGS